MKTAVSIPDLVYQSAEEWAEKLGMSRSALYAEALVAYLKEKKSQEITASLNRSLAEIPPEEQVDPFVQAAAHRLLKNAEW